MSVNGILSRFKQEVRIKRVKTVFFPIIVHREGQCMNKHDFTRISKREFY